MIGATSDGANINESTGTENSEAPKPLNPRRTPDRKIATRAAAIPSRVLRQGSVIHSLIHPIHEISVVNDALTPSAPSNRAELKPAWNRYRVQLLSRPEPARYCFSYSADFFLEPVQESGLKVDEISAREKLEVSRLWLIH